MALLLRFGVWQLRLPHNVAIALISALCLLLVGYDLQRTWMDRGQAIEASQRETANLTRSVAQHAETAIHLADARVSDLAQQVAVNGLGPDGLERLYQRMKLETANPPVASMGIFDAAGNSLVSSHRRNPTTNVADRPFFQHSLTHRDRDLYIGGTLQSRLTGDWIVGVSRRIGHADGSLAAVVTAAIDASYFHDFYSTFDLGRDGLISLMNDDGRTLVRQPFSEKAIGSDLSDTDLFRYHLSRASAGTFEFKSPFDGVVRHFSYRRVNGYPLVVAVGVGKDEQLAIWRADARERLLAAIASVLLLSFFAVGLSRQMALLAHAEQAALRANTVLDNQARDLAAARDQAERASAAKSRFLTSITHELRTPLHGILGYAEMLILEGGLSNTQAARLEAMTTAGQYLLSTINAVLDMSQIEADRLELVPVPTELHTLVRTCLEVVRPAAEAKGIKLVQAPVAPPLHIVADPMRLRQVLINLLGNAVKFTPTGMVEVRLQLRRAGEIIRLEVMDNGPGVWARHRDKLFQPFERLNVKATIGVEGTGLGLAMAARLVRLMGGEIGYEDNPGGGSVFWFELPCNSVSPADANAAVQPPPAAGRRLRVLVVDDEALNRNIASGFLTVVGHEVVCAESGSAALELAATQDFDVILMDVRMPGMNGLEATQRIRALPAPRCHVRLVAMTAQAFAEQIELCRQAGMDGHVAKPFTQAVLLAALVDPKKAPGTASELPAFDRATYAEAAGVLSPVDLAENLQILLARCETLLCRLRTPGMPVHDRDLADDAHKLAGGSGTFGFLALAAAARSFERAVDTNAVDRAESARQLAIAIEAAIAFVRQELLAPAAAGA